MLCRDSCLSSRFRLLCVLTSPFICHRLLDVAGGTGDIAFRFLEHVRHAVAAAPIMSYPAAVTVPPAEVTVCDINASMLAVGKERAMSRGLYPGSSSSTT